MKARNYYRGYHATAAVKPGPTHEVIARLAELIWDQEGRPAGRDVEFWLRAEAVLKGPNEPICHELPS